MLDLAKQALQLIGVHPERVVVLTVLSRGIDATPQQPSDLKGVRLVLESRDVLFKQNQQLFRDCLTTGSGLMEFGSRMSFHTG